MIKPKIGQIYSLTGYRLDPSIILDAEIVDIFESTGEVEYLAPNVEGKMRTWTVPFKLFISDSIRLNVFKTAKRLKEIHREV